MPNSRTKYLSVRTGQTNSQDQNSRQYNDQRGRQKSVDGRISLAEKQKAEERASAGQGPRQA
ncbi:MAG: hypothetical protein ACYDBH_15575, partial [Acidobacteriaceae bacterium]